MAIANPTSHGVASTTAGSSATNTVTSAAFNPQAGGTFLVAVYGLFDDGGAGATAYSISDTAVGTGTWRQFTVERVSVFVGTISIRMSLFVADIGATPGTSKTITVTRTAGTFTQWLSAVFLDTTGAGLASAISNTVTNSNGGGSATLTTNFGSAPAASSLLFGCFSDDATVAGLTQPTSWTEINDTTEPTNSLDWDSAYINGSGAQNNTWTAPNGADTHLAAALELPVAGAGGSTILAPRLYVPITAVQQAANW